MGSVEFYSDDKENKTQKVEILKDIDYAAALYLKAAKQEYVPAMVNLASLLIRSSKFNIRVVMNSNLKGGIEGKQAESIWEETDYTAKTNSDSEAFLVMN
jgi:TPR repeat protein